MRKIKDHYYKKAKQENYPARSVYKLEEVQKKHGFLQCGYSVLDLGCQPGSWSMYAARVVGPAGLVVGVDINSGKSPRLTDAAEIHWLLADICAPELPAALREIRPGFEVLLSDIAPNTTGNKWVDQQHSLRLARRTLELAGEILAHKGSYLCKVFQGEDFPDFVDEVRACFTRVKLVKPRSSRVESRELYVLGMGHLRG